MIRKPITIYASELAACIGMNRYRPVEDVARKIWSRTAPESYITALSRNDVTDVVPVQDILQELKLTERVSNVIGQHDEEEMHKKMKSFLVENKDELDAKNVALADITSFVFTERGKNYETSSLDRLQTTLNTEIRDRNSKFYKKTIESGDYTFILGGKVDGITKDGVLVEVKNRQYKVFPVVPIYEKIQIHAYMFLTDINTCRFVQSFKGQNVEHMETFSSEFWEDVQDKCVGFVKRLEELVEQTESQDKLLSLGTLG